MIKNKSIDIKRDASGIPHITAKSMEDLCYGQGYVHAVDRGMQMILMRILGQGRASELLDSSDEMLGIDIFFRKMNWTGGMQKQFQALTDFSSACLQAYAEGANAGFNGKVPWEFKLLGVPFEPWKIEDSFLISRMVGYLTLSQSQGEVERLLIEMVQAGVPREMLEELFAGHLQCLDLELIQSIKLGERIVPSSRLWEIGLPRMMASNNWVISGKKTASGKPILCNDPHLEINRIPNVWQEIVLRTEDKYMMGGCMPGAPGVLTGRNQDLSWGVTYSFMDAEDSWVEKCKDGKYFREDSGWQEFSLRKEAIKRKKKASHEITFYENLHGVLDGNPHEEGNYLATRWACNDSGGASLTRILEMWDAKTVEQGMDILGRVETSWSFVFADRNENIGFQMSGLMPLRKSNWSGLIPVPGWKSQNDWQGFASHKDLPRVLNPEQGFFITTNQDLNEWGRLKPLNMPMGPYRADRIAEVLKSRNDFAREDMFRLHYDVESPQARQFMHIIRSLLPETEMAAVLRQWDFRYNAESEGAHLFERIYRNLYLEVFGKKGIGENVIDYLDSETGTFIDFYINFDRILLSEESRWFGGESRDEIFRRVIQNSLMERPREWGKSQSIKLSHILFGGKMPSFLGFDRGPVTVIGGRATPHQGQIYNSAGRRTSFAPSIRTVIEMETDVCYTNLIGGPSDRRFSRWYASDVKNWENGIYKRIAPGEADATFP